MANCPYCEKEIFGCIRSGKVLTKEEFEKSEKEKVRKSKELSKREKQIEKIKEETAKYPVSGTYKIYLYFFLQLCGLFSFIYICLFLRVLPDFFFPVVCLIYAGMILASSIMLWLKLEKKLEKKFLTEHLEYKEFKKEL